MCNPIIVINRVEESKIVKLNCVSFGDFKTILTNITRKLFLETQIISGQKNNENDRLLVFQFLVCYNAYNKN